MGAVIVAQEFVVVAGHVDDAHALARLPQQLLHDVVVGLRPEPARAERPAVDDVADEVDGVGFVPAQEIEELLGLAAAGAKMHVGDKERAEAAVIGWCPHGRLTFVRSFPWRSPNACFVLRFYDNDSMACVIMARHRFGVTVCGMTVAIWAAAAYLRARPRLPTRQHRHRHRPLPDAARRQLPPPDDAPPVTIIRPVCGLDNFVEATLRSTFALDYPRYEILFCAASARDPVVAAGAQPDRRAPARRRPSS